MHRLKSATSASSAGHRILTEIARAELCARSATREYSSNLDDLNVLTGDQLVVDASRAQLSVQVSVGVSGRDYFVRVTGRGFDDYNQVTSTLVDQAFGPRLPIRCAYGRAKARRLLAQS